MDLSPIIGSANTLIISCVECSVINKRHDGRGSYVYTSLGATMHDDVLLKENLRYYLHTKKCTQFIVAGHINCHAFQFLRRENITNTGMNALKCHLERLATDNHLKLLDASLHDRQLMEANVIAQIGLLLSFDFIREKTERSALSIVGLIYNDKKQSINTIYKNGLTMNTLVKMN